MNQPSKSDPIPQQTQNLNVDNNAEGESIYVGDINDNIMMPSNCTLPNDKNRCLDSRSSPRFSSSLDTCSDAKANITPSSSSNFSSKGEDYFVDHHDIDQLHSNLENHRMNNTFGRK
ncbi:hypothetical protein ACHAXS_004075 [Conticribra weissflogii]